jgi:hypothetical protein
MSYKDGQAQAQLKAMLAAFLESHLEQTPINAGVDAELLAKRITDWVEQHESYSSKLDRLNVTVEEKICPACGQTVAANKMFMKTDLAWTLHILNRENRPLTMKMVAKIKEDAGMAAQFTKDQSRHIMELRYWGLIKQLDVRVEKAELCEITPEGRAVANMQRKIPAHLYVFNGEVVEPEDGDAPEMIYLHEVKRATRGMDFTDRMQHWLDARPFSPHS